MRLVPLILVLTVLPAPARDLGQWANVDKEVREWFARQVMPDNPPVPCCGQADAYWSDQFEEDSNGDYIAVVTDDRPDEPLRRQHFAPGTKVVIPKNKIHLNAGDPNPTGHGIVFLGPNGQVWCYFPPTGS